MMMKASMRVAILLVIASPSGALLSARSAARPRCAPRASAVRDPEGPSALGAVWGIATSGTPWEVRSRRARRARRRELEARARSAETRAFDRLLRSTCSN
jgi:hypothetical protein